MIYQVGKKQCSISGRKQNDIAPLESDFMVQPPSLLEFPGPLTPPPPWNFQFPPWWGSGYFLEPHIAEFTSQVARPCEGWERKGNKSTLVSLHFSWVTTLDKHWSNMKPIRNVCPACQGSEKGYSVNRSESTLMLVGRKRDEDKTPVMSAIFNCFRLCSKDTSFFWRL